ncbi:DUF7521 family protein [Halomicrobium salinisoli]|uniref:DUF7521 family protein n=1 Tax=Halomicrobium salinisoli TaxID=2878391 RepID=UPI001CF046A9|nr:hypothetical protein [Halomicrobium salinisoli]
MIDSIPPVVIAFKTATLLLGGLVTALAARAALRTRADGLAYLAVGFGVVTLGSLLAGVADQLLGIDPGAALVVETALTAVGFAVIAYSLLVTRDRAPRG